MIQVETILIPSDTDVEQHPSHLRSKATSVANKGYDGDRVMTVGYYRLPDVDGTPKYCQNA